MKKNIALLCICTGTRYWPYVGPMIQSAKQYFLPNHNVDFLLWTDIPDATEPDGTNYGATVFQAEGVDWPFATLMRYHLFLQQEEKFKDYDYLFYCDADMLFVDTVGDDILGDGLTGAQHPMYALRKEYMAPFEPNPASAAFIDAPRYYFAGGFQGGRTPDFIKAMWTMKRGIDTDFNNNYMAIWNDESHWNRYLFHNPPAVILDPSYVYPDSLIKDYYEKVWGKSLSPKLVTLTKKFSLSKEGGEAIKTAVATT